MRGWDDGSRQSNSRDGSLNDPPEPSEASMARVRAGRNERYSTEPRRYDRVTPEEVIDVLRRFIRGILDEPNGDRGRLRFRDANTLRA